MNRLTQVPCRSEPTIHDRLSNTVATVIGLTVVSLVASLTVVVAEELPVPQVQRRDAAAQANEGTRPNRQPGVEGASSELSGSEPRKPTADQGRPNVSPAPLNASPSWYQVAHEEIAMKTLGGREFWADVEYFHDWRIQQNVFTKHHRLLDAQDRRHAAGTLEECQSKLKTIRDERKLPKMSGRGVLLIHGLLRSSKCMDSMAAALGEAGYTTFRFDYPSTQISVPKAAENLHRVVGSLEGIDELSIVAHSMGGLITRAYFAEHGDPRIKRVVMVGTPNRGAELADLLYRNSMVKMLSGPGARQLVTAPEGLIPKLPLPHCEFAIIAGARGNDSGWNPLIPGDDDGVVTVESTKLVGAKDFSIIHASHTTLLHNRDTIEQTLRFLNQGRFRADRDPQPIHNQPADDATTAQSSEVPTAPPSEQIKAERNKTGR